MRATRGFTVIIDGEVLCYDGKSAEIISFGQNRAVGNIEKDTVMGENLDVWMVYVAFDCLYLQGWDALRLINKHISHYNMSFVPSVGWKPIEDYIVPLAKSGGEILHLPLKIRRDILADILTLKENRIELVETVEVMSLNIAERLLMLENSFHDVTMRNEEGLVVKDMISPYILGTKSRGFAHWYVLSIHFSNIFVSTCIINLHLIRIKLKPEYGDETQSLDLAVVGAYNGEGKGIRGQGFTSFLCAVKESEFSQRYIPFCKVGGGFKFKDLIGIR
jgi:ATP-dependent DNA ligase